MSDMTDLRKLINQLKHSNPINLEKFKIKEAISSLLGARLYVGQTLFFGYQTVKLEHRKKSVSLAQFIDQVAFENRQMSRRSYLRAYRVFERLVVQCGFWMSDLDEVDFTLLAGIAECKNIIPLTRRELVKGVQKRMAAGESYGQIAKRLDEVLKINRERPPRIPKVVRDVDHRLADVKMDMRLYNSAKNPPLPPPKVPIEFPGLELPRVVINWDKLKSE